MGWLIALGVLILLAIVPVGVSAYYDASGARVLAVAGPVRLQLFPARKQKPEKKQKTEKPVKKAATKEAAKPKKGGNVQDFLPLIDTVLDFVGAFGRKIRITQLKLKLILAADDPADLAGNYGKAWAALGNLIPLLERAFVIKNRDLEVECDFQAEKTSVVFHAELSVTVGRILALLIWHGVPVVKELMKVFKIRKGGAKA